MLSPPPSPQAQDDLARLAIEFFKYIDDTSTLEVVDSSKAIRLMVGVEELAKEYQLLSNQVGKILQVLTRIKRDGQAAAAANPQADKEPKIMKELCPDTLTKDNTSIEFRKFQRDFLVYY